MESIEELAKKVIDLANQRDGEFDKNGNTDRFQELDEQIEEIVQETIQRGEWNRLNELVQLY